MPRTARYQENKLLLSDVSEYDAGRYECRMIYSNGQVTRNHVELKIKRKYSNYRAARPQYTDRWRNRY